MTPIGRLMQRTTLQGQVSGAATKSRHTGWISYGKRLPRRIVRFVSPEDRLDCRLPRHLNHRSHCPSMGGERLVFVENLTGAPGAVCKAGICRFKSVAALRQPSGAFLITQ
jgi:hypothetical protein